MCVFFVSCVFFMKTLSFDRMIPASLLFLLNMYIHFHFFFFLCNFLYHSWKSLLKSYSHSFQVSWQTELDRKWVVLCLGKFRGGLSHFFITYSLFYLHTLTHGTVVIVQRAIVVMWFLRFFLFLCRTLPNWLCIILLLNDELTASFHNHSIINSLRKYLFFL